MSITRPTGSYARQMLDPGGWVEADEDTFYDRAQEYSQVLQGSPMYWTPAASRKATSSKAAYGPAAPPMLPTAPWVQTSIN